MKTTTETRNIATNQDVLRALGIKDKDLISLTLEMKGHGTFPTLTLVKLLRETDPADHIGGIDLDRMCQEALARVRRHIDYAADRQMALMLKSWIRHEDETTPRQRRLITIHRVGTHDPEEIEA